MEYALFCVWEESLKYLPVIRETLKREFCVLADVEFQWSERYLLENTNRFYAEPIHDQAIRSGIHIQHSGHKSKIGKGSFQAIVVCHDAPQYELLRTTSGQIVLCDKKVINVKKELRSNLSQKYGVHSSTNKKEFEYQCLLLFGEDYFSDIMQGRDVKLKYLQRDLIGAGTWRSLDEAKSALTYLTVSKSILLRGDFASTTGDIDLLVSDYQIIASVLNMKQEQPPRSYKGKIYTNSEYKSVDLRFPQDNYFPTNWAMQLIYKYSDKLQGFNLNDDDQFFTELYHQLIHKNTLNPTFIEKFQHKINKLGESNTNMDQRMMQILLGYMSENNYIVERPIDYGVKYNKKNANKINKTLKLKFGLNSNFAHQKRELRSWLSLITPLIVKKIIKKIISRHH